MTSSKDNPIRDYSLGVLLAVLMLVFSCGILKYVLPVLQSFVAGQSHDLPFGVRLTIGIGRFWWVVVLALVALMVWFERSYRGDARAVARRDLLAAINLLLFLYTAVLAGSVAVEFAILLH